MRTHHFLMLVSIGVLLGIAFTTVAGPAMPSPRRATAAVGSGLRAITLAGSAAYGYADGVGGAVKFYEPRGIALAPDGSLYVGETLYHYIRKVGPDSQVGTLTGGPDSPLDPFDLAVSSTGIVYVANGALNTVLRIVPGVAPTILAGGTGPFRDGVGTAATFDEPQGIALAPDGTLYVADTGNNRIRRINQAGQVSTVAGSSEPGLSDGIGSAARFDHPRGVAVDAGGTLYVADTGNHSIRTITPTGLVSTLAGGGGWGLKDGVGATARFKAPEGLEVDSDGTVYVADTQNHRIRTIKPDGTVTTVAGAPFSRMDSPFSDGLASSARFYMPCGIALSSESIYVADTRNHRIRILREGS